MEWIYMIRKNPFSYFEGSKLQSDYAKNVRYVKDNIIANL